MYSATKNAQGNYEIFQNGQRISTGTSSILGNYGLSESQLSTPKPAPSTSPTGELPPRNDQASGDNPYGYNGTAENPTNTDAGLAKINAQAPQLPTRNAGESASDFATRLLNSPFFLAGGNAPSGDNSAFVIDPATGKYVAKSASSLNRPITSAPKQNMIGGGVGTGSGSLGSDALIGGETSAEKTAREYLDNSFKTPETEADIVARKTAEASSRIQANKDYYASLLSGQATVNDQNTRDTNARAVLNGLSGSSEASTMATETATKNKGANDKILAQQNLALENIYKDIQDSANAEATNQKQDAYKSATDILARKDALKTKAVTDITTLAKSGFDFASIKLNDPVTYQHLADSVGGEAQLKAIAVLNRPQDSIIDKKIENGKYVIAYQNPLTGKVTIESTDLGVPPQYTKSIDLGDKIMLVPDNFDPTKDKPIYITKGIAPKAPGDSSLTGQEQKNQAYSLINKLLVPGVRDKTTGMPYIQPGTPYLTAEGFKTILHNAIEDGVTRAEFLAQYADKLSPDGAKGYGLTSTEQLNLGF